MKLSIVSAVTLSSMAMTSVALADNHQSMLGTWKGTAHAAIIGQPKHHEQAEGSDARFLKTEFTLVVEKDNGRNFAGYLQSKSHKEPIVGAFRADMTNGVYVDSDGMAIITRLSKDRLEACYAHSMTMSDGTNVASCIEYVRQ